MHQRIQENILADIEKRILIRVASSLPQAIHSDHLTILGFAGMVAAGMCFWLSTYNKYILLGSVICLAINWFGDSLDGTVARVRNRLRPRYGFYVHHVVDAIGALILIAGLAFSPYMSISVGAGLLIAYLLLSIEIYLATHALGVFKLSFWKWGPTELRILMSIGIIALLFKPYVTIAGQKFLLFDVGGICAIVAMALIMIFSAIKNTITLYKQETL